MAGWGKRWSDVPTRIRMRDLVMVCVAADMDSIEAFSQVTRTLPCRVKVTDQPSQALTWVETSGVSLVMADEWLKEMTGLRLLKEVARLSPKTARFLIATAETREKMVGEGATVHGVIGKPWSGTSLRRTILAILRWQEERHLEPYPKPGQVERRHPPRPHPRVDDVSRHSLT